MERQRNRPAPPQDADFEDEIILQGYITRLLNLQDTQTDWLTESDLEQAAQDMGLSETEVARLQTVAEAHRERGLRFLEHESWDEAIDELSQAMPLKPFDATITHGLATAYKERYWDTGNALDRDEAERYARRTIQLDTGHTASYELLQALKRIPIRATESGRPSRKTGVIFLSVLFAVVLLAMLMLLFGIL